MPAYDVERSIVINADAECVRAAIRDFAQWPRWSPWLCMEPDAKLSVHGTPGETGHGYDWDGALVGAGGMRLNAIGPERQDMDLKFLRPIKSEARVTLELASHSRNDTHVTWRVVGKMPFLLFFMLETMKAMVGMDYERGLKMLKEYVETGAVRSRTDVSGLVDVPRMHYVGLAAQCAISDIGDSMGQTMPALQRIVTGSALETSGPPGSIYHDFDIKAQTCRYTAFVPTRAAGEVSGATSGTIEPCRALKVTHTGSYEHLGNAWSTGMSYQRYKKLKPLKRAAPFEIYRSHPEQTPVEDIVTEIYLPLRS